MVVVVCSSNSNNGEKVDICSSKNELSSKKNFFLIFCPDLFCSFFYLIFGDALICFFCFLRMDFSRQMIGPNFVSFFLFLFLFSHLQQGGTKSSLYSSSIRQNGVLFSRENARRKY